MQKGTELFANEDPLVLKFIQTERCIDSYSLIFYPWKVFIGHYTYYDRKVAIFEEKVVIFHYGKCLSEFIKILKKTYANSVERKNDVREIVFGEKCNVMKAVIDLSNSDEPDLRIEKKLPSGK